MRLFNLLIALIIASSAQTQQLDSLGRALSAAIDTARIDLLNKISLEYTLQENYDSANHYQYLACIESEQAGYTHGLAEAYAMRGHIERYLFDNFPAAEAYIKLAESLYEKTNDKRNIESVYEAIWHTLGAQSKFTEARQYISKIIALCKQRNDSKCIADMNLAIASHYIEMGQFDSAFRHVKTAFDEAANFDSDEWRRAEQAYPGKIYLTLGDYKRALEHYRITLDYITEQRQTTADPVKFHIWTITEVAETYALLGKYDSAFMCYNMIDTSEIDWKDFRVYLVSMGEVLLMQEQYKKALEIFQRALPHNRRINDRSQVIRTLLDLSKSYAGLKQHNNAISFATQALTEAEVTFARKSMMDAYGLLYKAYDALKNPYQANIYFRLYSQMKDSVASDRVKGIMAAASYENQLALLQQDNIIIQQWLELEQQRLSQSALIRKFLIAGIVIIFLLAVVLYRNFMLRKSRLEKDLEIEKLESKKISMEMQEKTSELEMAALKAQMNPHFIFNCLNAINHFILNNDPDLASEYLTKFSRLIRLVLNGSSNKVVTLKDELTSLTIYVELEQLRFKKNFSFALKVDPEIDTNSLLIPPMLMQPFVENAIWHGLMQSTNDSLLSIDISQHNNALRCVIEDNGIGRARSNQSKSKSASYKKSMGMDITRNRLKLLYDEQQNNKFMVVTDLYDAQGEPCGTRVQLDIPLKFADDMVDFKSSFYDRRDNS